MGILLHIEAVEICIIAETSTELEYFLLHSKIKKKKRKEKTKDIWLVLKVPNDDAITDLEPDILECEVKWALASEGDTIPVELFQILKDDAVKVLHSIYQHIGKTQQCPQDWKRCFHSNPKERQCQRMLKLPHNCTHLTR